MRFWVTLEGRDTEVEFQTEGDRVWLEVEGRRLEADARRLPDGEVYSLLIGGRSHEVRVAAAGEQLEVTVGGTTLPVEVRHPLEKALQNSRQVGDVRSGETIVAPMPGLVVALHVRPGDVVSAGQPVAVVEAMKMQNELSARHGGRVVEVMVSERASVRAGQPLMRLAAVAP
jgi:biotin carboxyl carrier protein